MREIYFFVVFLVLNFVSRAEGDDICFENYTKDLTGGEKKDGKTHI